MDQVVSPIACNMDMGCNMRCRARSKNLLRRHCVWSLDQTIEYIEYVIQPIWRDFCEPNIDGREG